MTLPNISLPKKPTYIRCAQDIDFLQLFDTLEEHYDECFFLESLGEHGHTSRYAVIGFSPSHIIRGKKRTLFIDDVPYHVPNPYMALREIIPQNAIARNYAGGLVGYISYDAIEYVEPTLMLKEHPKFDQFRFGVYEDGLVLDTVTQEVFYFYYRKNRLSLIESFLKQSPVYRDCTVRYTGDSLSVSEHALRVAQVKEEILSGNTFQCQVGFRRTYHIVGDTRRLYHTLRTVNPSPFMYYVKTGVQKIIGASPELLFSLRNGEMETFPLAGTIKRGKTAKEDSVLARTLLNDPKEQAEHAMLVDLHRNDIGRVASFGTVKVRSFMDIKKFSHVQHISSEITGIIRPNEDMFSALMANFPAGTLTGAPKIESMKIIDRMEPFGRGPYGGALGHFGFNGDCMFSIPIRTLFLSGQDGYIQASGGIVQDSVAEHEYQEVTNKLAAMHQVLLSFEKGEKI